MKADGINRVSVGGWHLSGVKKRNPSYERGALVWDKSFTQIKKKRIAHKKKREMT